MDKEKEHEQSFTMSDVVSSIRRATAKKILQDLYDLARKNKYSGIGSGDILFYAKENYEFEYDDFEVN